MYSVYLFLESVLFIVDNKFQDYNSDKVVQYMPANKKGKKGTNHPVDTGSGVPSRDAIEDMYKWKLEDIYSTLEDWERDFQRVEAALASFEDYRGRLSVSEEVMAHCLELEEDLGISMGRIFVYGTMKSHEDTSITENQALADRAMSLMVRYSTASSFMVPEISAIPEDVIRKYMDSEMLEEYRFFFQDILRMKNHLLSAEEERILAGTGEMAQAPETIFSMLTNADLKFPSVKDEKGEMVELTEERYFSLIKSKERKVRKNAFRALHRTYRKYENSLAAMYSSSVKGNIFNARTRKYTSSLEAALEPNNIPLDVYSNVIETVNSNLQPLHEYVEVRKKALDVKKLHMYDLYVPLVDEISSDIEYDKAVEMVLEGIKPLGENYVELMKKGLDEGWIDIYENRGKRKGAYSWGSYGTHPYVLLNYNSTLRDVFTLAHEMGHALHSWFSHSSQPYIYGDYTIFLAEVASTTNEALLIEHLLSVTDDVEERKYLLNYYLEQIRTTVYRQTLFAEFEKKTHELAESGQALTKDLMCDLWHGLNEKYYGPSIVVDEDIDIEWARIPHFYSSFYVYQYVTGYAAATAFSRKILSGEPGARKGYLEFLKKGSSDYSVNILRTAGVDMTVPTPLEQTLEVFRDKLEQLKELL